MPKETGKVTASRLNVRKGPSSSFQRVGQLKRGDKVSILARRGSWYEVKKGNLKGFAHSRYVLLDDDLIGFLHERSKFQRCSLSPTPGNHISRRNLRGRSAKIKKTWNQYGGILSKMSKFLSIDPEVALAVLLVESSGEAMGSTGKMVVRFENHIFFSNWGRSNPDQFSWHFRYSSSKRWQGHKFRSSRNRAWKSFHGNQRKEWEVFEFARDLDESAAIHSISMGLAQIMGFNYSSIGYESPKKMFDRFSAGPRYQIIGMFDFIKGAGRTSTMLEALRRRDYLTFATFYNGSGAAASYSERIRSHVASAELLIP